MFFIVRLDRQASEETDRLIPFALGTLILLALTFAINHFFPGLTGILQNLLTFGLLASILGMVICMFWHFIIMLRFAIRKISKLINR